MTAREIAALVSAGADPHAAVRTAAERVLKNENNAFRPFNLSLSLEGPPAAVGRLAGVPVVVKDNFADRGQPCGCASKILAHHRADYTATALEHLRAAGAVVVGRSNMDEFAMGSSTEYSAFGAVLHPMDASRTSGGSSGGSAAAVAGGVVPIALGSDSGGSARQPAAFCGVVGFKPTYGRISRRGLVAFASSLDTVAPLAKNVRDAALAAEIMSGPDPGDATTRTETASGWVEACDRSIAGLHFGIWSADCMGGIESGVAFQFERAKRRMREHGASFVEISLDTLRAAGAIYRVIAAAEAASNLARFDGLRFGQPAPQDERGASLSRIRGAGFGREVQRRLLFGTLLLGSGHAAGLLARASDARLRLRERFRELFGMVNLILSPTTPTVAFPLGAHNDAPLDLYDADRFTVPANLAGLPAISVPFGQSQGLPVGMQLMARPLDEATMLAAAGVLEAVGDR